MGSVTIRSLVVRRLWKRPRRWASKSAFLLTVIRVDREFLLWYRPGWGYRPGSVRRHGGDWATLATFPVVEVERMKRRQPKVIPITPDMPMSVASLESKLLKAFPNVLAHCAVTRYDDGTARRPGQVQISVHGPMWQLRAKDYDGGCQLTCVALTFEDALAELELLLGSEDAPWEQDHYQTARGPGKKK